VRPRSPGAGNAPYGFCWCGCGERTSLAVQTDTKRGYIKDEPMRYCAGHWPRGRQLKDPLTLYVVEDCGHETACWIWQGGSTPLGYGRLSDRGRLSPAHRWFYENAGHKIPTGLLLDHLCRVPACVNPDHLEPVSVAENAQRGTSAKLTMAQVVRIRALRYEVKPSVLAAEYGVTSRQIRNVWNGVSWANVEMSA
jgi:hypothetical protein